MCLDAQQNWTKKCAGEKSRGSGGKLPPRFAKKQSTQQQQQQQTSQPQPPAAAAPQQQPQGPQQQQQQQPPTTASQHPHLTQAQPIVASQNLEGSTAPLPSIPVANVDFTSKSLPPAATQAHSTLGTELWENKVAGPTVLPDVKKREWTSRSC